jgi:hypothetical protein
VGGWDCAGQCLASAVAAVVSGEPLVVQNECAAKTEWPTMATPFCFETDTVVVETLTPDGVVNSLGTRPDHVIASRVLGRAP